MKHITSRYIGIFLGSTYGLILRIFFDVAFMGYGTDLYSITFIWIVPIILGITPMIFASKEQLSNNFYRLGIPIITVLLFFVFCYITRIEDIICLIFLALPFLFGAAIGGFVFAVIIKKYRSRKGIMYSILCLPFVSGLAEEKITTPIETYYISTSIIINSTPDKIWDNIVRVKQIEEYEFEKGFFNYAGIPRPLYAELNKDTIGATRIGHFENGLKFSESVIEWDRNKKISFNIKIIPTSVPKTIFEQHVLKGQHFKFLDASYNLKSINENQTKLTLTSNYQLETNINNYGSYWGDKLLTDFQVRLLKVIKNRCDK